jgi:site-specific DNA recombinase
MDFAKIVEQFDKQGVSFVSVTQQFNATSSMGRLTLNVLLSFAQFEREVTGERIRDKIAASKRKGMWMGGVVPTGYELKNRELVVNPAEAEQVRNIFRSKRRISKTGRISGEAVYSRGALYKILNNRIYLGEITHKKTIYPGRHDAIIDRELWNQVHQRLTDNLQAKRKRPRSTANSLLTGLLYDESGKRFTPSHAAKRGRRYRYYVSRADSDEILRLPAPDIEDVVINAIRQLLQSRQRLLDVLGPSFVEIMNSEQFDRRLPLLLEEAISAVPAVVRRVVIKGAELEIQVSQNALRRLIIGPASIADDNSDNDIFVLSVEVQFLKYRGKVRLVLPPDSPHAKKAEIPSLIGAIAKAHLWVDQIVKGEALNQRAIAASIGVNERYVSRILPLAFLAPAITEMILEGRQPDGLSISDCVNLPMLWNEHRRLLGSAEIRRIKII